MSDGNTPAAVDTRLDEARTQAQKQWNENPCGAVEGAKDDNDFFRSVEDERYTQQYWQRDYFDYQSFAGKHVLEIGVGLGTDIKQFARHGAICHGVDITNKHLELTQRNFELEGLNIDLHHADATQLPFSDNSIDCVHSFGVLHHIPDIETVLAEVHRVLKPGGQLQIAVYHKYSIHTLALFVRAIITGDLFRLGISGVLATIERGADGQKIKPYVKLYSRRELGGLLKKQGFEKDKLGVRQIYFLGSDVLNKLKVFEKMFGWYVCAKYTVSQSS